MQASSHAWINQTSTLVSGGSSLTYCVLSPLGLRFGVGSPGCLNVEWITEPRLVTTEVQCNDARIEHRGGDTDPALGKRLARITCGERVVRCTGNCK